MRRGRIIFGGMALFAVLVLSAPAAYAAGGGPATNQGYPGATKPPAHHHHHATTGGNAGVAGAHKSVAGAVRPATVGSLPFTGVQLGLVVLVGMLLIGGGVVLRTSGRNRTST
jgi:hypothetical protein